MTTLTLPLRLDHDHLIATNRTGDWLVDTGAPSSFGRTQPILGIREGPIESDTWAWTRTR